MRKYFARLLYRAVFERQEASNHQAQELFSLRQELQQCQKARGRDAHAFQAMIALLNEGVFHARLYALPNGTPVLLQLHHSPGPNSWDIYLFRLNGGTRDCIGKMSAVTRHIDSSRALFEMDKPDNRYLFIHDFTIRGDYQKGGLGSYVLQTLTDISSSITRVCRIEGCISPVDWERVDLLERFYTRHGFTVTLDHEEKEGTIVKNLE